MKNLRNFTKAGIYKGTTLGAATVGAVAFLAGGSASAMSYSANYSPQGGNMSYGNNHQDRDHRNKNNDRHDHRHENEQNRRYYW